MYSYSTLFGLVGYVGVSYAMQITQYDCTFPNLAPDGCTQYFFGMNTDTVQTFNFQGGMHLANQDQNICVRYELCVDHIAGWFFDPLFLFSLHTGEREATAGRESHAPRWQYMLH